MSHFLRSTVSSRASAAAHGVPAGLSRREAIGWLAGGGALALAPWPASGATPAKPAAAGPLVEVWKDPSCGCCKDWISHLQAHGYRTRVHEIGNTAMRARVGVQQRFGSCHTALVLGYVIEGHVPASDITRLLEERPQALGLAVPGMPVGSPGMDGPEYKGRRDRYDVLLLAAAGSAAYKVWQSYR